METFSETFQNISDGETVTTAETGFVSLAGTWTGTFANNIGPGPVSVSSPTDSVAQFNTNFTSRNKTYSDIVMRVSDNPVGPSTWIIAAALLNASVNKARIGIEGLSSGNISIKDDTDTVATSTWQVTPGEPFRLAWMIDGDTGTQILHIFGGSDYLYSTVPTESITGAYTGGLHTHLRVGNTVNIPAGLEMVIGSIKWNDTLWVPPETQPTGAAFPFYFTGDEWYTGLPAVQGSVIGNLPYSAMAIQAPDVPGRYLTICRTSGLIYSGSDPAYAIQKAIDRVSNFDGTNTYRGGKVGIGAGYWLLTSPILGRPVSTTLTMPDTDVFSVHICGEGGIRGAPANSNSSAGTHLEWSGGSNPNTTDAMGVARTGYTLAGAVLNLSNDAHGYVVEDVVIKAGEQVADYAAVSAGRGIEWWRCQFREAKEVGLYVTNGADTANDRYVQQRIMFCRSEGNKFGYWIESNAAGSGCTDGRAYDIQTSVNSSHSITVKAGGWQFTGGHLTGAGGLEASMVIDAMTCVSDIYFDTNGANPCIKITSGNVQISNARLWTTGRAGVNLIEAETNNGIALVNCLAYGTDKANRLFNGTGSAIMMTNCGGPSAVLTELAPGSVTPVNSFIW